LSRKVGVVRHGLVAVHVCSYHTGHEVTTAALQGIRSPRPQKLPLVICRLQSNQLIQATEQLCGYVCSAPIQSKRRVKAIVNEELFSGTSDWHNLPPKE